MRYYTLLKEIVEKIIPKHATGAYFLGLEQNREFLIRYIGRSDTRLRMRLLSHVKNSKYSHFSFIKTDTIQQAFEIECREWHNAIELDNKIHPKKPKNLNYKCPYCVIRKEGLRKWKM